MAVIGLTTFLPMYVQAVMGRSPLTAGFMLTAMVLGWPIAATLGARNFTRFGLRPILIAGAVLLPVGALPFVLLTPTMSPFVAGLGSLVMGFGMGFFSKAAIVLIQDSVGWSERGAATASNLFARNLGSTLGANVLGVRSMPAFRAMVAAQCSRSSACSGSMGRRSPWRPAVRPWRMNCT